MSIIYENQEKLHGKVFYNEKCIGSCVPYISQGHVFALTCHHVFFEKNNKAEELILANIKIKVNSRDYPALKVITEHSASLKSDILIIDLGTFRQDDLTLFADVILSTEVDTDGIRQQEHAIIVCPPNENHISYVKLAPHVRSIGDFNIESSVPKGTFFNQSKTRGGAKEYAGISGSGLFMSINSKIYLLGLLAELPNNSITEPVVIKRLDSLKAHFNESQSFSEITKSSSKQSIKLPALLKNVCFVNFTERSKNYYHERACDKDFITNIEHGLNTWLHGGSGTGKTALIARNMNTSNINHIACDLEPVTIDSCDSILRGMLDDISMYFDSIEVPKTLDVRSICNYLQTCELQSNTIITIDEMSCSCPIIIDEFCQKIMSLVRQYQKVESNKNIVFVISSIFHPKEHGCNPGKLMQSFEIISSNNWATDIEKLYELQNMALGNMICSGGKLLILDNCRSLPRLLTKLVQQIYRSGQFSVESVNNIVEKVINEYKEYE